MVRLGLKHFVIRVSIFLHPQIYGQYKKDLGSYAKFQAKKLKKQDKADFGKVSASKRNRLYDVLGKYLTVLFVRNKNETRCLSVLCKAVPQISSVSAYITQFKMPNTHLISFPGVSDTHVKFYFTQTFYIMRVIISPRETKHS